MAHNRWEPQLAPGAMFRVKQRCTPSIPQTGNIQQTHLGNKDKPSREGTRVSLKHIFSMNGLLMWHFKRTQREGDTWSSLGGVSRCDKLCNSLCADVIVFHYSRYYKHQTHNDTHRHHLLIDGIPRAIINSHYFQNQKKLNKRNDVQCVTEHSWWAMLMGGHVMMLPWCLWGHYYHIWYLNISEVRHHRQTILQAMNIHYHLCTEPGPVIAR